MGDLKVARINNIIYGSRLTQNINQDGLGRYIFSLMKNNGKKVLQVNAITQEEETYEELNKKCIRVALELQKRGIREDDIILQISENNMVTMIPIISAFYLNAVAATLDPSMSLREITHLIRLVRPKIIFSVYGSVNVVKQALDDIEINTEIVVMNSPSRENSGPILSDFFAPHPNENDFLPKIVDDIKKTALILFSSGTTGLSKPMKCSHYGLLYTITGELMCGFDCKVVMHYNSFYWISAYLLTLYAMMNGGKKIIASVFEPTTALEYFEKYKVTTILVPTTYMLKFTKENTENFKSIYPKYFIYGGSGITVENSKKINSCFPNRNLYFVYGLSEVSGFITGFTENYKHLSKTKLASVCMPIPGTAIKVADVDSGEALPPNAKGEIRIFTKAFFNGYGNDTDKECYDEEGFIKTGDIGYYDEDNCIYITDRIREMFKYQSWHIIPNSIENIIFKHPSVQEAIVIGIPHEDDGHRPMAVVVLQEGCSETSEIDIETFVNNLVLDREKLRAGVRIVKRLSKTSSGKIMRTHIRDLITSGEIKELQVL